MGWQALVNNIANLMAGEVQRSPRPSSVERPVYPVICGEGNSVTIRCVDRRPPHSRYSRRPGYYSPLLRIECVNAGEPDFDPGKIEVGSFTNDDQGHGKAARPVRGRERN